MATIQNVILNIASNTSLTMFLQTL